MVTNNPKYQRTYMSKYINSFYGKYSIKISNIKRSTKSKNNTPNSKLTLTTDEFIQILEFFNFECAYCGQTNIELIPSLITRFSHGGALEFNNVVCSCSYCNNSKLNKRKLSFQQWYSLQPFYSQERYYKILQHITKE